MIYKFIDNTGTFTVDNPHGFNLYLPLTDKKGRLLSSIGPNLAGDIKKDNEHFLTPPAGLEDIRSNLMCRRDFFIKTEKETLRLSCPYNDTLEAGLLYQKVTKRTSPLQIEVLNFIPYDIPVEVMRVRIINTGKNACTLTSTSSIPLFGRSEKNLRDHRHVSSLLNRIYLDNYGIVLKPTMVFDEKGHRINETCYFVLGFEDKKTAPVGQFPTLDFFLGENNLILPQAIEKDVTPARKNSPEFNGKEAVAALRFKQKKLKPGQEVSYYLIMGIAENRREIGKLFRKLDSRKKIEAAFNETREYWLKYLNYPRFDFKNECYNNWLVWVKIQPTLRKLFGCSFLPHFDYGKGGRGWRDLWQDALSLITLEPDKARDLILNNFKGVRIDGSNATIITSDNKFISDRNRISRVWMDHGVWPYLTLKAYVHKTNDLAILLEETTYFRDAQLKRAKEIDYSFSQKDYLLRNSKNNIYKGSVLEHVLLENLVQFFNVGEHNIIRLENADWNDGLDMASDNGESVAFSFMYAHNLKDICVFLNELKTKRKNVAMLKEAVLLLDKINRPINYSEYKQKQKRLQAYFERAKNLSGEKIEIEIDDLIFDLQEKAKHLSAWLREKEWLKEGFFNGYYDNKARRVEGKASGKTKMMLPSQVFAIMSGVAQEKQIIKAWASINKYLKDNKLKGFHLNTDFGSVSMELGRAFGFSYGDKENGAFFNHMVVMLANALYKRGFIKEGFEVINSAYEMAISERSKVYPQLPEYFNNEGKGLYLYLTGSASWYIYTLIEEILGFRFYFGNILLNPKLTASNFFGNKAIEAEFRVGKKRIKVVIIRTSKLYKAYSIKYALLKNKKILPNEAGILIKKSQFKNSETTIKLFLD